MDGLGINLPGLITQFVNFGILLLILWVFLHKPLRRVLDERRRRIEDGLKASERAQAAVQDAQAQAQTEIQQGRQEGQALVAQAQEIAQRIEAEARDNARQEAEQIVARARQEIQQERNAAIEDVRRHFGDLAITAAERVVERSLDRSAHHDLIEKVLEEGFEPSRE